MSNMDELVYLTEMANDPALATAKRKIKKGVAKNKKKLIKGTRKAKDLKTARKWNRTISASALINYHQFDPELATVVVISVRPDRLGGDLVVIDGQHTSMLDLLGECDTDLDTLELHHSEDASLEEVQRAEAEMFKKLNTERKSMNALDIIRNDIFLGKESALRFENVLKTCNLNIDNIGSEDDDAGTIPGQGARMIKCITQFGEDYPHCIIAAVDFMRRTWGSEDSPLLDIRDDMIHGLTTLLALIKYAGKVKDGSPKGLNGRSKKLAHWMENEMGKSSMRRYYNNTSGGNTHFKIAHNIIKDYNFWAEVNAPTMTISTDYLHQNGVYDESRLMTKAEKKALPNFPADIQR